MPPKVPAVPSKLHLERLALTLSVFGGRRCPRVLLEARCLPKYPRCRPSFVLSGWRWLRAFLAAVGACEYFWRGDASQTTYPRPPEFRFERLALARVQYHNTHGMSKHIYL